MMCNQQSSMMDGRMIHLSSKYQNEGCDEEEFSSPYDSIHYTRLEVVSLP